MLFLAEPMPMSMLVILLKDDPQYQVLENLFTGNPHLKTGFTLRELLTLSSLSLRSQRVLKELFGGRYSTVLTPGFDFEYQNEKWMVEEIDTQRGFRQFVTTLLERAVRSGDYPLGSAVSTEDFRLIEFLVRKQNEVYQEDLGDPEAEGFPTTQELLDFISRSLKGRYGKSSILDYQFVQVFLDSLHEFEAILIKREFGA
jgi:hypothetical protein